MDQTKVLLLDTTRGKSPRHLTSSLSPVHTEEYFADKAEKLSASPHIDTILLYDTAGVWEKERLATLVPALVRNARGKKIEFHSTTCWAYPQKPIWMRSISAYR